MSLKGTVSGPDLRHLYDGGPKLWAERWGRAVYLHQDSIALLLSNCMYRETTWQALDECVQQILIGASPDTSPCAAAVNIPPRFLAEPAAESVPSPQQEDAGGVGCATFPAPSVPKAKLTDSIRVRRLDPLGAWFVILARGSFAKTEIRIVLPREELRRLRDDIQHWLSSAIPPEKG